MIKQRKIESAVIKNLKLNDLKVQDVTDPILEDSSVCLKAFRRISDHLFSPLLAICCLPLKTPHRSGNSELWLARLCSL